MRRHRDPSARRPDEERSTGTAREAGVRAARERFGGLDVPASLLGMLVAVAMTILLGGLLAAVLGTIAFQIGIEATQEEITIGGLVAGLVTLFIAFVVGGYAAGRMARYNGALNGVMTAVWMLLLMAIFAVLGFWIGSQYNVFLAVNLPTWLTTSTVETDNTQAALSGVGAILLTLLGGLVGGILGERYHRAADVTIAEVPAHRPPDYVAEEAPAPAYDEERASRPLGEWSDEELWDELRALRRRDRTVSEGIEAEPTGGATRQDVEEELVRRGYDPTVRSG
ncbi:MAG: TIGR04086 family membrane protein [Actinomycetota bacterium]|nr:TIGR04086 family membrane protein [Actinomycetota bacterium]